ncbi:VOC family protein [Pelomonas sp. KK5]|uniref:VOC family protein n=1 Tax=Pelomonas sp. KK5 TaxID=1855730 RepID=UPI00097C9025|nr:VOC family protein [Pelomonas sp. KK5]
MNIELSTAYIGIDCRDPVQVGRYLHAVVGLMPAEPAAGAESRWRNDGKAARVWLRQAERDDAAAIGLEAVDAAAYRRVLQRLAAAGVATTPLSPAERELRGVGEGVSMMSPWGVKVDVVLGLVDAATPFASPHYPDGFVTGAQGFGHYVFVVNTAEAYEASRRFAMEALGMKLSDTLRMALGPAGAPEMNVSFLHANPRHHSLALAFVPMPEVPQKLHHVNFEVAAVAPVGAAYERALAAKTPLANTIGQHENDGMVSFYSVSPGGWLVEIGATGRTVGEDWDDRREYHRISLWGHQPPTVLQQLLVGA